MTCSPAFQDAPRFGKNRIAIKASSDAAMT
jgi:hypothetical protein